MKFWHFFFLFWKNIFKTFFLSGVKQNYFFVCLFVFRRKNVWIVCMECKKILFSFHMPVRFRKTTICVEEKVLLGKEFRRYLKKKHLLPVESSKNCKFLLFSCCKDFEVCRFEFQENLQKRWFQCVLSVTVSDPPSLVLRTWVQLPSDSLNHLNSSGGQLMTCNVWEGSDLEMWLHQLDFIYPEHLKTVQNLHVLCHREIQKC